MPSSCITPAHYFSSRASKLASLMPQKALNESTDQTPTTHLNNTHDDTRASILIFISAQAIGSLGFAMSIFAIWFGWLLPTPTVPAVEEVESKASRLPSRHHRRSPQVASIVVLPPTPIRRASAPIPITPILASRPEDISTTSRHVYFEDSSITPITRRNTLPEKQSTKCLDTIELANATVAALSGSPVAINSALPTLPTHDGSDDTPVESDSSPHSSKASLLKPSSRLQKLKLFGNGRTGHRPEPLDKISDQASIASIETNSSEKSAKRTSGGFVAAWTLSRNRTAPDVTAVESSAPSPSRLGFTRRMSPSRAIPSPVTVTPTTPTINASDILSPTFLTRKNQRRISAPIPRTSPYGAPYFAAPPMLLDSNYPAYLKTLPQFEDEMQSSQISGNDEPERGRGRTPSIRRVNLNLTSDFVTPKQRSASVDWTKRPNIIL